MRLDGRSTDSGHSPCSASLPDLPAIVQPCLGHRAPALALHQVRRAGSAKSVFRQALELGLAFFEGLLAHAVGKAAEDRIVLFIQWSSRLARALGAFGSREHANRMRQTVRSLPHQGEQGFGDHLRGQAGHGEESSAHRSGSGEDGEDAHYRT